MPYPPHVMAEQVGILSERSFYKKRTTELEKIKMMIVENLIAEISEMIYNATHQEECGEN